MKKSQELRLENSLRLTQKSIQSLKVLQMDVVELEKFVAQQYVDNPVLDHLQRFQYQSYLKRADMVVHKNRSNWIQNIAETTSHFDTLEFYLNDQIERLQISKAQKQLCRYLVLLLDSKGYLPSNYREIIGFGVREIEDAAKVIKSLEPAGVGAESVEECLRIQLIRKNSTPLSLRLVNAHLEEIADRNYKKIAKACRCSLSDVEAAVAEILTLNPKPGTSFSVTEQTHFIVPEYCIEIIDGALIIQRKEEAIPSVAINPYYQELFATTDNKEVREYLKEKISAAKELLGFVEHRMVTLELCVRTIVEMQRSFFVNKNRQLMPLSLATISEATGLHTSTISRAINGKYIEFDGKTYPLKFFLVRSIQGEHMDNISVTQIKVLIEEIVASEDASNPKSDQEIVELLGKGGIVISRRTVAKYREEMNIPSSRQRKK